MSVHPYASASSPQLAKEAKDAWLPNMVEFGDPEVLRPTNSETEHFAAEKSHCGAVSGWSTGGTGGTADLQWPFDGLVQKVAHQDPWTGGSADCEMEDRVLQLWLGAGSENMGAAHHPEAAEWCSSNCHDPAQDDVGSRLEAMVEDLAGSDFYTSCTMVEETSSQALADSGLRLSAPTFVPGQLWTGNPRSYVD